MKESTETPKPKTRTARKPQRVEIKDARGNIARPFEKDIDVWLAKGWKRVNPVTSTD